MAKNILICDDAAFMRMMIKGILGKGGYDVVGEAENGLKAVEKYKELSPDLVLMDITMPEMDGIQAVKEIKKIDANAKVIMCSASRRWSLSLSRPARRTSLSSLSRRIVSLKR